MTSQKKKISSPFKFKLNDFLTTLSEGHLTLGEYTDLISNRLGQLHLKSIDEV